MKEKICIWIAWRLPKDIIKWAAVRLMTFATFGRYSDQVVPDLTAMDALKRWEEA